MESLRGRLLVATPAIGPGPFWRSVVLMLDHDDEGALGVVVNNPLESDVDDVLPDWADLAGAPECLFAGGPVAMDSALAIAVVRGGEGPAGWQRMTGRIGLVDLEGPVPSHDAFEGVRIFAGYAGWSPGQLEGEIEEGSWVVADMREEDVLSPNPESLWHDVLYRQDGEIRYLATFPDDPALN